MISVPQQRRGSSASVAPGQRWSHNPLSPDDSFSTINNMSSELQHKQQQHQQQQVIERSELSSSSLVKSASGFSLSICTDRTFFTAPGIVSGQLLVTNHNRRLHLREIIVELEGYEQAEDKIVFIKRSLLLQGTSTSPFPALAPGDLPPCDLVDATQKDSTGFYKAQCTSNNGNTPIAIPFAIEIPRLPSSLIRKRCHVNYLIRVIVEMKPNGRHIKNLIHERPIQIYESRPSSSTQVSLDQRDTDNSTDMPVFVTASEDWHRMIGGRGKVEVKCEMESSNIVSGNYAFVSFSARNLSKRPIAEVSMKLIQRLKSFKYGEGGKLYPLMFERNTISKAVFPDALFDFNSDPFRSIALAIHVPVDAYDVKEGCRLIEQTHVIQITVRATMSKPIVINIPVSIAHSSSLARPLRLNMNHINYLLAWEDGSDMGVDGLVEPVYNNSNAIPEHFDNHTDQTLSEISNKLPPAFSPPALPLPYNSTPLVKFPMSAVPPPQPQQNLPAIVEEASDCMLDNLLRQLNTEVEQITTIPPLPDATVERTSTSGPRKSLQQFEDSTQYHNTSISTEQNKNQDERDKEASVDYVVSHDKEEVSSEHERLLSDMVAKLQDMARDS